MGPMRPLVALLSDFGSQDHYLGAMRGAVLTVCPDATLVDLVHDLPSHDVEAGALALDAAHTSFPLGTVFLAVVDPGVGSERRGLAAEAGGYLFVGPDNGLLSLALLAHPSFRARQITNTSLLRSPVSPVFHGRDVFAPLAGHLARGLSLELVGDPVDDPVIVRRPKPLVLAPGDWEVEVILVDRFGNLVTSLPEGDLDEVSKSGEGRVEVSVAGRAVALVKSYSEVPKGELCALIGSSGRLELAVNQGSAAAVLAASRGTKVRVRSLGEPVKERML
jgi:S-adenosylmethionine hydrolase